MDKEPDEKMHFSCSDCGRPLTLERNTELTAEEENQLLNELAKIIADIYLKENHLKESSE